MKRFLAFFMMIGCSDGPASLTVVDDLRILNVAVEPASPAPGEVPALDLLVADPLGAGFESWSWWCVDDVCGDGPVPAGPLVSISALACAPGACDGPGELADPASWMADLGIEGVSLVTRTVPQSPSAEARLNDNPVLALASEPPAEVAPLRSAPLTFAMEDAVSDGAMAYGYATWGGFRVAAGRPVVDGSVTLEYVAPEEPGEGALFVVVEDGLGGSAVWSGDIVVR
ncbi:MAG: hypothetical protein H6737_11830 [Alphaproteobacteria bacterium]|nr:hypothetical protein [Alphaproteobacteria bacterium]